MGSSEYRSVPLSSHHASLLFVRQVGNSSSTTSSTTNTTTGEVPVEHVVQASDVWPTFDATAAVAAAVVTTPTSASEASSTGVGLTGVGPTGVTLSVSTEFGLYAPRPSWA